MPSRGLRRLRQLRSSVPTSAVTTANNQAWRDATADGAGSMYNLRRGVEPQGRHPGANCIDRRSYVGVREPLAVARVASTDDATTGRRRRVYLNSRPPVDIVRPSRSRLPLTKNRLSARGI